MNLEIQPRPLGGSPLVRHYLERRPEVEPFFGGDPFSLAAFAARWRAELQPRFGPSERARAARALRPTSERARERLAEFCESGGAVVTTGQQAGLFTGPLYTIYKILTTVRLAAELERTLGIIVLPVFWTASEDHDWAEVNHAYLVDRHDALVRVELPTDDPRPLPIAERRLPAAVEAILGDIADRVGIEGDTSDVLQLFRAEYRQGVGVAVAFRRVVERLFAPFDLLVTDAADPALKEASVPVLRRELEAQAMHEEVLRGTAARLEEVGYSSQVPVLPGAANVFFRTSYGRERLLRQADGWRARESGQRYDHAELLELLEAEPARFSPNVLLRPIVESAVFPVLAYVAGPGELSYFGQLRSFFSAHGFAMPLVFPRAAFRLVEPEVRARLGALGLTEDELELAPHELLARRSRALLPREVEEAVHALRAELVQRFDALAAAAGQIDPTLVGAIGARRNRALAEAGDAERKILRAVKRADRAWAEGVERVRNHLVPLGSPQERVLNGLPYLARHGLALLDELARRIRIGWTDSGAAAELPAHSAAAGEGGGRG